MLKAHIRHGFFGFTLDAEFEAPAHGVTAVFGPSGSGKSSLLLAIAGLSAPDFALISLDGVALTDTRRRIRVAPEARRIACVFQRPRLFPHMNVGENVRYGLTRAAGGAPIRENAVVEVLGLRSLLHRNPASLSGGEAQRVQLARALLSQPRLLLLDEPLTALDAPAKAEILTALSAVAQTFRLPMIYVSHALAEVLRLADHVVALEAGRVMAQGPLSSVLGPDAPDFLAERADLGVVLEGVVAEENAGPGQSLVQVGPHFIRTARTAALKGAPVRIYVMARDVVLALSEPEGLSVRNTVPGAIESLRPRRDGAVIATVRTDGMRLAALISADAVGALGLAPGKPIFALVKAWAAAPADGPGLLDHLI
jgi:molybdate transport system ATP-binding protein